MRGIFYGPTIEEYSHARDAVGLVDRVPLLLMIATSIFFGIFPVHFYNVIRSGVDPLIARITQVVPLKAEGRANVSTVPVQHAPGSAQSAEPGRAPTR
jgi:NADH-quinone oxidoreductase subunit M